MPILDRVNAGDIITSSAWNEIIDELNDHKVNKAGDIMSGPLSILGGVAPEASLSVRGNLDVSGHLRITDDSGDPYPSNWIGMAENIEGTTKWLHIGGITDAGQRRLALFADKTFISGDVGIGTNSPSRTLEVNGDFQANGITSTSFITSTGSLYISRNNSNTMRFFRGSLPGELVIIGSNPNNHLKLSLTSTGFLTSTNNSPNYYFAIGHTHSTGFSQSRFHSRFSINQAGSAFISDKLGIGRTAISDVKLQVVGGSDVTLSGGGFLLLGEKTGVNMAFDNNEIAARNNGAASTLHLNRDGGEVRVRNIAVSSDKNLKQNIQTLKENLKKILSIKGVSFKWKNQHHSSLPDIGLLAQNVENVFPELITTDNKGFKGLNYIGLIAPIIEAIKEQQEQINALKLNNQQLQQKLDSLP